MRGDRKRRGRRVLPVVTAATVMALSVPALAVPALAGVAGAVPAAEPVARSGALTEQEVTFHNGGLALHGTIIAPGGRATGRPGVVLVGGSGRGLRDAHREEAEAFARAGIVALVYDKRTVGYSMLHRPLPDLAGDALAAVEVLRARPDVDAAGVGLWGLSEGTWVSELAAARSSSVSFLVLVGASAVSPARQQAWYLGNALVYAGVSGSMLHALPVTGTRVLAGLGVLPNADFDPVPVLSSVRQPVLALWGELDRSSPPGESAALMDGALERAGNSHRTLRFLTGAQHDLHRSQDGFDGSDEWAPGYPGVVTEWITGLGAARPVVSVDPLPAARPVPALPPPAWYESAPVQVGALAAMLLGFAAYPLVAAASRLRGRGVRLPFRRSARTLAAIGLVTPPAFAVYLLAASNPNLEHGPLLFGRTLPWAALQVLALGVVVAAVAAAAGLLRHRGSVPALQRVRVGAALGAAAVFVPWAVYWGLLTA